MSCDPRLLSYYRDGALSYEERYELERHLEVCTECTTTLRGLMRLAQVVRSLPMAEVSPSLRHELRQRIAAREERRRRPLPLGSFGRALAPAAVAASVAVSALVIFRPGSLELPNKPLPAITAQAPAAQPESQAVASAGAVGQAESSAGVPKTTPGAVAAVPSLHGPGIDAASGPLPIKMTAPVPPPEPIARFYSGNRQVQQLLGTASPGSRTVTLLEQSFQGGLAIWRSDTREIYVLRRDTGTWSVHPDTWHPGDRISVDVPPPPGAMVPAAGFGTVWRSTPEIKSRLGWAVYEPRGSGGSIQTFEHGLIVWTPHGLIYVLSSDGHWRTYPDATPV